MYIISKHKDYYDGVVGSVGMDKTIVYERNIEEISDTLMMPVIFQRKRFVWDDHNPFLRLCGMEIDKKKTKKYTDVRGFIVGFCGKLYLGWKLIYEEEEWNVEIKLFQKAKKTDIIYGFEEAKKYLKTTYWKGNAEDDYNYVSNYDPIQVFRDINAPVFIYDYDTRGRTRDAMFIINPILKEFEFYKIMDTFTAFQEIQMFISGVLGTGEKNIVEVEDKYKIGQHGFDKWSFRKEPQKK